MSRLDDIVADGLSRMDSAVEGVIDRLAPTFDYNGPSLETRRFHADWAVAMDYGKKKAEAMNYEEGLVRDNAAYQYAKKEFEFIMRYEYERRQCQHGM